MEESYLILKLIFMLLLSILSLFVYLILIIFGVIGLISTSKNDIIYICPLSNIWYYLLVSIILLISSVMLILFSSKDDDLLYMKIIAIVIIYTGSIIWGGYELFNSNCISNFNETLLYKITLTYWVLSLFIVSISIIYLILNRVYDLNKKNINLPPLCKLDSSTIVKLGEAHENLV